MEEKMPQLIVELAKVKAIFQQRAILSAMGVMQRDLVEPELKWLKVTQLYIPNEYQRSVKSAGSLKNINHIASNFNWADFGVLIVCELEKANPPQYAVIDGQHRFRAAEQRQDIKELPCAVLSGREAKEQAQTFIAINSKRIKLHSLHEHRAALVAGNPDAVSVEQILKKAKVTLASFPMNTKELPPRCTQAIGTLYKMLGVYNEKHIVWALTIITEAFEGVNGALRASMIKTMTDWSKNQPDTDRAVMLEALAKINIDELERNARAARTLDGRRVPQAFMDFIEKKYNAARKAA